MNGSTMSGSNELEELLQATLSQDNKLRSTATKYCSDQFENNYEAFVTGLIRLLVVSHVPVVRNIVAIYLRKQLPRGEPMLWQRLSVELQQIVKNVLIDRLLGEPEDFLKRQIGETVIEVATITLHKNEWPELLPCLYKCSSMEQPALRQVALKIFGKLCEETCEQLLPQVEELHAVFEKGLVDANMSVRLAAVDATCSAVQNFDMVNEFYQDLVPHLMNLVRESVQRGDLDPVDHVLRNLNEVALNHASFLAPMLTQLGDMYVSIAQLPQADDGIKRLCVRFFLNAAVDCPPLIRRNPSMVKQGVELCMAMLLHVDDDPQWGMKKDPSMDYQFSMGDTSVFDEGELSLDHLGRTLGPRVILPACLPLVDQFIKSADWKFRHAGLYALTQIVDIMKFSDIPLEAVLNYTRDSHVRVQFAALECLGMMANDHQPHYQKKYHREHIAACLEASNSPCPRVQVHASCALFNFFDFEDDELQDIGEGIVMPYVDVVLERIMNMLKSEHPMVQEQSITTLASVAGACPNVFVKFYDHVVPWVKSALSLPPGVNDILRCRAIECISFIALAVRRDVFIKDAPEVLRILVNALQQTSSDDMSAQYVMQALPRFSAVLGADFVSVLPTVMPYVFRLAETKIDTTFTRVLDSKSEEYRVQSNRLGGSIEDKSNGVGMLSALVNDLGESGHFPIEYLERTAMVLLDSCDFFMSEEIRACAVTGLPQLVTTCLTYYHQQVLDVQSLTAMYVRIIEKIVFRLTEELNGAILEDVVNALRATVLVAGELSVQSLNETQMRTVGRAYVSLISKTMRSIENKRKKIEENQQLLDANTMAEFIEDTKGSRNLNYKIADSMSVLIETHGPSFLAAWDEMMPTLNTLLSSSNEHAVVIAIFIFDDLVEHLRAHSTPFFPQFVPVLLNCVSLMSCEPTQASAYGLGLCAQYGGTHFQPYVESATERMLAVCAHKATSTEFATAVDTSMGALLKIIIYQRQHIDVNKVVSMWFSHFPMREDREEALFIYTALCELIESDDGVILGANGAYLPSIVTAFASALGTQFVSNDITNRIRSIFSKIKAMPGDACQQIINSQPHQIRNKVEQIFQQC